MDDVQRMVDAFDVQPCESPPSAPRRIEVRRARPFAEPSDPGEGLSKPPGGLPRRFFMCVGHAHRAERQRGLPADAFPVELDQFQAAAPQISHDPVRARHSGHHPEGGEPGLLRAVQHPDARPAHRLDVPDQALSIACVAHRRGRDQLGIADAQHSREPGETGDRPDRLLHGLRCQEGAGGEPSSERAERPFVVEGDEGVLQPVEDDQADRVRADVDHRHRPRVRGVRDGKHGGGGLHQARAVLSSARRFPRPRRGPRGEAPRPERFGWFMKYSWAENGFLRASVRMRV